MRLLTSDRLLEIHEVSHNLMSGGYMRIIFYPSKLDVEYILIVKKSTGEYILRTLTEKGGVDIRLYEEGRGGTHQLTKSYKTI